MADQTTSTRGKEALGDRVERLMDELRDALIEGGRDEQTVDATLYGLRVPETNVVGNLADLQRMGGAVAAGASATEAVTQGVVLEPLQAPAQTSGASQPSQPANGGNGGGEGDREALEQMTKVELQEEAAARGVDVPSSATKAEIIDALEG